ncbi:MAG: hypothetical protein ACKPKO_54325, partial [Candidatus Fonsibacter sp.]
IGGYLLIILLVRRVIIRVCLAILFDYASPSSWPSFLLLDAIVRVLTNMGRTTCLQPPRRPRTTSQSIGP